MQPVSLTPWASAWAGASTPGLRDVEIALPSRWTNAAAAGWGGDLWHYYVKNGQGATVLATLWDTARDAGEFEAALRQRSDEGSLLFLVRRRDTTRFIAMKGK